MAGKNLTKAVGYFRTSSAANTGADKDSEKRQRQAVEGFAVGAGYEIVECFYDEAVSGTTELIDGRPGFSALLDRIEGNGVGSSWSRTLRGWLDRSSPRRSASSPFRPVA